MNVPKLILALWFGLVSQSIAFGQDEGAKVVADKYLALVKTDAKNAKVWSFCATAALYKSRFSEEQYQSSIKRIITSLQSVMSDKSTCPCPDAIPQQLWDESKETSETELIKVRNFNGEVGGSSITHPVGLEVSASEVPLSDHLEKVLKPALHGQKESFYFKRRFKLRFMVKNTGTDPVAIYHWSYKAICPEDVMGREENATSHVSLVTPYIPGDVYVILNPGEKKIFFSSTTDFAWCLPKNNEALLLPPRYYQALITCAAISGNGTAPASTKQRGNFPSSPTPPANTGSLDPEIEKLIITYKKSIKSGNKGDADKMKTMIFHLTEEVYPAKIKEVAALMGVGVPSDLVRTGADDDVQLGKNVEKFTINGETYYGTKAIPQEILGKYWYEKNKEPIVDINSQGTGYFQVHGVKAYPAEFWILTDSKGNVIKQSGTVGSNYKLFLILRYGNNGEAGWQGSKAGQHDMIDVAIAFDRGFAIILGERYRKL